MLYYFDFNPATLFCFWPIKYLYKIRGNFLKTIWFGRTLTCRLCSVSGETLNDRMYSSLSGGELFERITAEGYTMSEAEVINYMRQICEGVKHMHERNIIHLGKFLSE